MFVLENGWLKSGFGPMIFIDKTVTSEPKIIDHGNILNQSKQICMINLDATLRAKDYRSWQHP